MLIFEEYHRDLVDKLKNKSCTIPFYRPAISDQDATMASNAVVCPQTKCVQGKGDERPDRRCVFERIFRLIAAYVEGPEKRTAKIAKLKTRQAIELLLQSGDMYRKLLFDFQEPPKIDLQTYMNHNFKYNIPVPTFAKLTVRSRSTFKRDFTKIFETTPEKWLLQKRLEYALYLFSKRDMRPSQVYLQVGFENLSHFSLSKKHSA